MIREQARGLVSTLKQSGALPDELAITLIALVTELERELHDTRRRV